MTLQELQRIVVILSNSCHVRWWAHYNYPRHDPWQMAICCIDEHGRPVEPYEHDLPKPFTKWTDGGLNGLTYYIWERTNERGEPFRLDEAEQ